MARTTNMDHYRKTASNIPQLCFTLPINEVKENVEVGELGSVIIPVRVIGIGEGMIEFEKRGKASSQGGFSSATTSELREQLPIAER